VCPDDEPFGECAEGNPCENPDACANGSWCLRDCGCRFKCLDNALVTIATTAGEAEFEGASALLESVAEKKAQKVSWGLGPIALPAKIQLPNLTALAESVHGTLANAVREAALAHVAVHPDKCPGGKPKVQCMEQVCADKPCGEKQVCVPQCGSCTEYK